MTDSLDSRPTEPPSPGSPFRRLVPGQPAPDQTPAADADDTALAAPEAYDPADYRWVPVRRRPRFDGWTEEKQRRLIETLADTGLLGAAAGTIGYSHSLDRAPRVTPMVSANIGNIRRSAVVRERVR